MNSITFEINNGMSEMESRAEQVSVAVSLVNELSGKNKVSIEAFMGEVEKFNV